MPDDPEKLVAEALRAQATSSGAHKLLPVGPTTNSTTTGPTTGRSTSDLTPATRDAHPSSSSTRTTGTTRTTRATGTAWLLLLAVLLGLASGTVVAVMTLR